MSFAAVLSIGSNVGDSAALLRGVVDIARRDGLLRCASAVFATAAWGGVEQDDFLNAVLLVEGAGSPRAWLDWARAREAEAGRTREVRWGPRTLDVDIVACTVDGRPVVDDDPELTLPHPRAAERAFVLVPWLDADPAAVLGGRPVSKLLASLDPAEVAGVRRTGLVLVGEGD